MNRIRVGVICGGRSAEHEVSLQSARNVVNALDRERFAVAVIGIDRDGAWHDYDPADFLRDADDPRRIALHGARARVALVPGESGARLIDADSAAPLTPIDVMLPVVHGTGGEDGVLQGTLASLDMPYVGSGVLGSAVAMDKDVTKRLLRDAHIDIAPFVCLDRDAAASADFGVISSQLGNPLFVKPANQGSSVGVSRATTAREFNAAINLALRFDHKLLVEAAVVGREIECAVLGNEQPQASATGEIVLADGFYSYDTKYVDDNAGIAVPTDIDEHADARIREVALAAYRALGCAGLARVDVFLTADGEIVVNEVNTLPGFTRISMYPKLWQASGLSYADLLTRLVELALERHELDRGLAHAV